MYLHTRLIRKVKEKEDVGVMDEVMNLWVYEVKFGYLCDSMVECTPLKGVGGGGGGGGIYIYLLDYHQ